MTFRQPSHRRHTIILFTGLLIKKTWLRLRACLPYIDQLSEESIPSLPTGTCIFSGTAGQMPLKLVIPRLEGDHRPQSGTLEFQQDSPSEAQAAGKVQRLVRCGGIQNNFGIFRFLGQNTFVQF